MSACSLTRRVTHLTFDNARVVMGYSYCESEGRSESRMGSGTSQGPSEWSGDKVSYKESVFQGSKKGPVFVSRSSEGFRVSTNGSHLPRRGNMDP
jgi:hypothetical protein